MMKLRILAFALSMSLATTGSALSLQQEQQDPGAGVSAIPSASPHHPLFTVKYVLVSAQPDTKEGPRINFGDDRAAIHAVPLGGPWQATLLGSGFGEPNTYVCSGWECKDAR
ncbi:hypothetical protein ACPPVV_06830 [Rhodanobacter sp. Col0626]|uniref:hypothetical protein n=1 Tax=Rhodanobacter sp. Col0626 TaxID=3415679 RepID=UPI003CEEA01C